MEPIKKGWPYIIAVMLYALALAMFLDLENVSSAQKWVFGGTFALSVMNVAAFDDTKNIRRWVALVAGIYMVVLSLIWMMPINPAWAVLLVLIAGVGLCIWTGIGSDEAIYIPIGVAAIALLIL